MIKPNIIWILVTVVYVLSFIALVVVSLLVKKKDKSFSFLNHFPFELMTSNASHVLLYIFLIASFLPLMVVIPLFGEFGDMAVFNIVLACLFGLLALVNGAMIRISTNYLTPHIKLATGSMAGSFLLAALSALHLFLDYSIQSKFKGMSFLYIIFGCVAAIFAIGMLVIMFNPKLKDWAKLEEIANGETKVYERPKLFPLAYSEWASILTTFIAELLFLVSMINF